MFTMQSQPYLNTLGLNVISLPVCFFIYVYMCDLKCCLASQDLFLKNCILTEWKLLTTFDYQYDLCDL